MSEAWRTATKANLYVWDVNTLDFIPWDGSPTGGGGGGTGGTVDQGAAGVSPWLVSINGVPHVVIDSASLGTVAVSAASLPLPSGAATDARQDTGNASLASIDGKLTSPLAVSGPLTNTQLRATAVPVDGSAVTQPVSATALPLPANAAQEAGGNLATLVSQTAPLTTVQGATASGVTGTLVQAAVSDARESYLDATLRPLSLTTDGRLRTASSPAATDLELFRRAGLFDVPDLTALDNPWDLTGGTSPLP